MKQGDIIEAFVTERVAPKSSPKTMAAIGVLTLELRLENSHSLKEKRHVVKSLKDRLRHKFNVSVAEIDYQDLWQRALMAAVTVSSAHSHAEKVLQNVEAGSCNAGRADARVLQRGMDRIKWTPADSERLSEALREELEEIIGYELTDPRIDVADESPRCTSARMGGTRVSVESKR